MPYLMPLTFFKIAAGGDCRDFSPDDAQRAQRRDFAPRLVSDCRLSRWSRLAAFPPAIAGRSPPRDIGCWLPLSAA